MNIVLLQITSGSQERDVHHNAYGKYNHAGKCNPCKHNTKHNLNQIQTDLNGKIWNFFFCNTQMMYDLTVLKSEFLLMAFPVYERYLSSDGVHKKVVLQYVKKNTVERKGKYYVK